MSKVRPMTWNSATRMSRSGKLRYSRDVRGVASIEMALIFPVMLIVFVGLVDVANLLTANRRVTQTASTLGDLVTQATGTVDKADLNGFFSAARSIMAPFPDESTWLEYYTFTNGEAGVELDWQHKSTGANCGAEPVPDEKLMSEDNDVVIARVCYDWEPVLGIILGISSSSVQDQIMMRPRQTARIVCLDCT